MAEYMGAVICKYCKNIGQHIIKIELVQFYGTGKYMQHVNILFYFYFINNKFKTVQKCVINM